MHTGSHPAPATRPALEVADILRGRFEQYRETHRLSTQQQRAVKALMSCRTAQQGGFTAKWSAPFGVDSSRLLN